MVEWLLVLLFVSVHGNGCLRGKCICKMAWAVDIWFHWDQRVWDSHYLICWSIRENGLFLRDCQMFACSLCVAVLKSVNIIVVLIATYIVNFWMELFLVITFKLWIDSHFRWIYNVTFSVPVETGRGSRGSPPTAWRKSRPAGKSVHTCFQSVLP